MSKFCLLCSLVPTLGSALQLLPPLTSSEHAAPVDITSILNSRLIHVESSFAAVKDSKGLTLIPPSTSEFAETFRQDLRQLTNSDWDLQLVNSCSTELPGICLGAYRGEQQRPTYQDGAASEEAYEMDVSKNGSIFIGGTGARGVWWGTRTLLQSVILSSHLSTGLSAGRTVDGPAFATRGFMLDAGRKWYSPSFLKDLCTYASFFKMSEFHYHSADNYPLNRGHNETWNEVYSQFALQPQNSSLDGLIQRGNETLSPADFEDFQLHCAQRGVTVVTEIEAPGHALSITKWKPELALNTTKDLLNLTHPDTVPLIKAMWADFLPRIHAKEVHIGADEYDADLADDYIRFVNEMADFINTTSGKSTRIWGTYEPSPTNLTISKDIIVQHWQYGQSDPVQLVRDGYQFINSEDTWAYMSLKNDHVPISPAPYPQFFNESRVLNFGGQAGLQWSPSYVNSVNLSMQLDRAAVENKGAIFAAWNDNGVDASTQLEAYYAIRRGIPLVAARAWSGSNGPKVSADELDATIDYLSPRVPGANLDRVLSPGNISNADGLLVSWSRESPSQSATSASVSLGYGSKGMNYTLSLVATGPFVLSSADVNLTLSALNNSAAGLTFTTSDNWPYPLRSTSYNDSSYFPASPGQGRIWADPPGNQTSSSHEEVRLSMPRADSPMNITITTDALRGSRCWIDGAFVGRFEVLVFGGHNVYQSWSQMAFVAPVNEIDGPGLKELRLWDRIVEPNRRDNSNSSGGQGGGPSGYQSGAGLTASPTYASTAGMFTWAMAVVALTMVYM